MSRIARHEDSAEKRLDSWNQQGFCIRLRVKGSKEIWTTHCTEKWSKMV